METGDPSNEAQPIVGASHAVRLFSVRLWKQELDARSDYRGSVRDLSTGASRGFGDWSAMVAFMVAQVERRASARVSGAEEVRDGGE